LDIGMTCCDDSACSPTASGTPDTPRWRGVLWAALIVNAG
jgi:hypothetical protein